jgi:hypothetical protein
MEVLDKLNAAAFGIQDMELLGVFAQQAAIAISHAQQTERLGVTVLEGLKAIAAGEVSGFPLSTDLLEQLDEGDLSESQEVELLTALYREIRAWGEDERNAILKIMASFAEYVRSKPRIG